MPLPLQRARISSVDPEGIARDATTHVLDAYTAEIRGLFGAAVKMSDSSGDLDPATLHKTPTYRRLRAIAAYGHSGGALDLKLGRQDSPTAITADAGTLAALEKTLEQLLPALRKLHILGVLAAARGETINTKAFAELSDFVDVIDTFGFDSDLGAVLVAAWARAQLEQNNPITATQLGVLAGLGSVSIGNAIRAGSLKAKRRHRDQAQKKNNPYEVRAADAQRFLRERQQASRS